VARDEGKTTITQATVEGDYCKSTLRSIGKRIRKTGAQTGAPVRRAISYLMDSKKCFGIIRAALSLLKPVYDFPHNPKVAGSNPAPATNKINNLPLDFD
jgi:hypothetical protein